MNSNFFKITTLAGLGVATLLGCSSESKQSRSSLLDGDLTALQFSLQLSSNQNSTALQRGLSLSTGLDVQKAYLNVQKIELWLPEGQKCLDVDDVMANTSIACEDAARYEDDDENEAGESEGDKYEITGPFVFDLITGQSTPAIQDLQIPSGVYKRVRLTADVYTGSEFPELTGKSISMEGQIEVASILRTLTFEINSTEDIDVRNDAGFEVKEGGINSIVTTVNLEALFGAYNVAQCILEGDLVELSPNNYSISESNEAAGSCEDILENFEEDFFAENEVDCEHDADEDEQEEDEQGDDDLASDDEDETEND
jgi:hypothetical protein